MRKISVSALAVLFGVAFAQNAPPDGPPAQNPAWVATGRLTAPREYHTATLLADGRVLLIGGAATTFTSGAWGSVWSDDGRPLKTTEIYDPSTATWQRTGDLNIARRSPTATLLRSGEVLVTGGSAEAREAELYDPVTGTWRRVRDLLAARSGHTATLLADGRVLVVGGAHGGDSRSGVPNALHSSELFDPLTESWSGTGTTAVASFLHRAVLLRDGRVLAIGNYGCAKVAELYEPDTGLWTPTPLPPLYGCADNAALLPNGSVLVTSAGAAQLFDPITGAWRAATAPRSVGAGHTLTALANGRILAAGGRMNDFSVAGAEVFDPATEDWTATAALTRNRAAHSATLLTNGSVLVAGGYDGNCCDMRETLDTADLFYPGLSAEPVSSR